MNASLHRRHIIFYKGYGSIIMCVETCVNISDKSDEK